MKITLLALNGSFSHSSLAIRCLRDALQRETEHEVTLVEATLRDRTAAVLERLVEENADLYGFSLYIWNLPQMLSLACDLKTLRPKAHVVLGGPEASFATERFDALPFPHTVITGEGESAIVTLAELLATGKQPPARMAGTPDPHFTEGGIRYPENEPVSALVYYESSRGCPFSCRFCLSSAGHGVRAKSAEQTLADLLLFEQHREPLTVKLVDRTFNFDRERAKAIWQGLLDERYTKCYHFEICAALLDEESFEILSHFKKGKVQLEIGLQSTNEKTLAAIGRRNDADAVIAAAARIKQQGNIHVHLDLIAGLPHEDLPSFRQSFDRAFFAADHLQLGFLKLLHGTALREDAASYGIRFSKDPPYTVLETDCLSFGELCRLRRIAALLDRMTERGRFAHSLHALLPRICSPFDLFDGFAAHLASKDRRELQQIGSRELFFHLADYGMTLLEGADRAAFLEAVKTDFAACEVRRVSDFEKRYQQ
ncbi:MAG: DUF4080 domain-containing protein [Ruminococcaceae bacterium]|nr:DUF4080 domain-containing protein [Oscillospiraceae bacterium]